MCISRDCSKLLFYPHVQEKSHQKDLSQQYHVLASPPVILELASG